MSRSGMTGLAAVAAGVLMALAGPAVADDEHFEASANARLSDGTVLRQDVPIQSTGASASVYNADFSAGALAGVPVVGGEATASALVPAARADGLPFALGAGAQSGMTYSFHLDGVDTGVRIPVAILGGASVNWTNGASGEAGIYLAGESGDTSFLKSWIATSTGDLSGGVIRHADEILYLVPGVSYEVQLYAKAFATVDYAGLGGLSSYVLAGADPVFTVQGDYADHYRVVGVPQPASAGVPEPAAWALMLLGFGALGTRLRGQRSGATPVGGGVW